MEGPAIVVCGATAEDAPAMAAIFSASRRLLDFLPELHTVEEDLGFITHYVLPEQHVTVAEVEGQIAGFIAEQNDWITLLYVDPRQLRAGVGSALMREAQGRHDRLQLWCFQKNHRGRAFYLRHGFLAAEFTSGAGNEAHEPDVRYVWQQGRV